MSEKENILEIPNAVPFELPSLSAVEIYFWGDFIGVQDTIFIWVKYESNNPNRKRQTVTEMIQLAKNQSRFILLASGSKPIGHANGYIFILDTDDNSGTGFVRFEGDSLDEKVWVDAAQNTVCYQNNAVTAEFQITCMPFHPEGYEASNFRAYSLDYDSYKNISDRAICVLKIKRDDDSITIFAFSTFFGYHKGYISCSIKAFGFVPDFN